MKNLLVVFLTMWSGVGPQQLIEIFFEKIKIWPYSRAYTLISRAQIDRLRDSILKYPPKKEKASEDLLLSFSILVPRDRILIASGDRMRLRFTRGRTSCPHGDFQLITPGFRTSSIHLSY